MAPDEVVQWAERLKELFGFSSLTNWDEYFEGDLQEMRAFHQGADWLSLDDGSSLKKQWIEFQPSPGLKTLGDFQAVREKTLRLINTRLALEHWDGLSNGIVLDKRDPLLANLVFQLGNTELCVRKLSAEPFNLDPRLVVGDLVCWPKDRLIDHLERLLMSLQHLMMFAELSQPLEIDLQGVSVPHNIVELGVVDGKIECLLFTETYSRVGLEVLGLDPRLLEICLTQAPTICDKALLAIRRRYQWAYSNHPFVLSLSEISDRIGSLRRPWLKEILDK